MTARMRAWSAVECAAVCNLCADVIARDSPYVKKTCKLCQYV